MHSESAEHSTNLNTKNPKPHGNKSGFGAGEIHSHWLWRNMYLKFKIQLRSPRQHPTTPLTPPHPVSLSRSPTNPDAATNENLELLLMYHRKCEQNLRNNIKIVTENCSLMMMLVRRERERDDGRSNSERRISATERGREKPEAF